jgi:chlorobactene glucosyltransferase
MLNALRFAYLIDLLSLPLALRADWLYRKMERLPITPLTETLPKLSIILPARNEAQNLQLTLPKLVSIDYPGDFEIIVVDDDSEDGTAALAEEFGTQVLRLKTLPAGWLGKPHACHQGAARAKGEWLLFTDADVLHHPNGPANAVHLAQQANLDALSLFLEHHGTNFAERLSLMVAYAGLFAGLRKLDKFINGQYILLRREVYQASGGFAAVRQEKLEDLALGALLYQLGYRLRSCRGGNAASVKMYSDHFHLWHGMTRLSAGTLKWLGVSSLVTGLFTTMVIDPLLNIIPSRSKNRPRGWAVLTWGLTALGFIPWARRLGSGWYALLAPLGAVPVLTAAVWGIIRQLLGRGIVWKDRIV